MRTRKHTGHAGSADRTRGRGGLAPQLFDREHAARRRRNLELRARLIAGGMEPDDLRSIVSAAIARSGWRDLGVAIANVALRVVVLYALAIRTLAAKLSELVRRLRGAVGW